MPSTCPICNGRGSVGHETCKTCEGTGRIRQDKEGVTNTVNVNFDSGEIKQSLDKLYDLLVKNHTELLNEIRHTKEFDVALNKEVDKIEKLGE